MSNQYDLSGTFNGQVNINSTIIEAEHAYDVRGLANPYLGLRPFSYAERDRYAGRDREVQVAVDLLTQPGAERPLLFVTGASGSGKSSFAQAGLVPGLEVYYAQRSVALRHAALRPGAHPMAAFAAALGSLGLAADPPFAAVLPFMTGVPSPAPAAVRYDDGRVDLLNLDWARVARGTAEASAVVAAACAGPLAGGWWTAGDQALFAAATAGPPQECG